MVIKNSQNLTFGLSNLLDCPRRHLANPMLPTKSVFALGMCLAFLQVLDGWMTSLGMTRFGVEMEGNLLLRDLMIQFGHVPTLTVIKLLSITLVMLLIVNSKRVPWIKGALGAMNCVYIVFAIIPWTYILFVQPLFLAV